MSAGPLTFLSESEADTLTLGRRVGTALVKGDLLTLDGPLGAGKTALVRGIAGGIGADPELVRSPTFVLHHVYRSEHLTLHHLDLYRLGSRADVTVLDLEGLLETGAVAIEWGEHADLETLTPLRMSIEIVGPEARAITLHEDGVSSRIKEAWPLRQRLR